MSWKTARVAALAAALLTLAAPAGANVQVGSSGWQWGNPQPQGNTVRAMSFAGTTGYAAGDVGTVLKTTDGGTSWTGLPAGTLTDLTVVQALDASTVFAAGGCVARRSTDGGRTFTAVRFAAVETGCRFQLRDLSFVSGDVGWVLLDNGAVYTTTDGGASFAPRTAVPQTRAAGGFLSPGGLAFVGPRTGYATSGGTVFQTLDGGVSWRAVTGGGPTLNRLWFADAHHGFAVGDAGLVLRSDDGGASWTPRTTVPGNPSLTSIRCNTSGFCVLTTPDGRELVRVTGYGDDQPAILAASSDPVHAAGFASPQRVVAAGENGTTVVSDDVGATFAQVGGSLAGTFIGLRAGGERGSAYAFGSGGSLARTRDGGRTWSTGIDVPTGADLRDAAFPTATDGFALDADGSLFHTTNGGSTWQPLGTGSPRRPRAVLAPDASTVLAVGPRGMRRSTDAGATFTQVRASAVERPQLDGIAAAHAGSAIFAWGPTTVARSVDGGHAWTALRRPGGRSLRVAQVAFANARTGLLRDTAGRVWRTASAGGSWTPLPAVGTEDVVGMTAASARTATLVVESFGNRAGGYLLRTVDAGATWQPQLVVNQRIRPDGLAAGRGADYLLAGDAELLFSTSGGVAGAPSALTLATQQRHPAKPRRITVSGRLQPAGGTAQVTVSALAQGQRRWLHRTVSVASNGTFATSWSVERGTTTFVAQWAGDFASAGAGSKPLTVTVAPGARRRRR